MLTKAACAPWFIPALLEYACRPSLPMAGRGRSAAAFHRWSLNAGRPLPTGCLPFEIDGKTITPPIILAIGLNYASHAKELGKCVPEKPIVFAKGPNTLTSTESPIIIPTLEQCCDYEGELAVIIGPNPCRGVKPSEALKYVSCLTMN